MGRRNLEDNLELVVAEIQGRTESSSEPRSSFEAWGYLENPFPSQTHPMWRRFWGQEDVRRPFNALLTTFLKEQQQTTTFMLYGSNRVGKTHFQKHHEWRLTNLFKKGSIHQFVVAYTQVSDASFLRQYRDIISQIDRQLIDTAGQSIIPLFVNKIPDAVLGSAVKSDLVRGLLACKSAPRQAREHLIQYLQEWIEGGLLDRKERQALGIFENIRTASQAVSTLGEVFRLGRRGGVLKGLILFLDEFELVWQGGNSPQKRMAYFQQLRQLIDIMPEGLFLTVAQTLDSRYSELLKVQSPPLYLRLHSGEAYQLKGITQEEAWKCALWFMEEAREEYIDQRGPYKGKHILTEDDVMQVFSDVSRHTRVALQGNFFGALHQRAVSKVQRQ